MFGKRISSRRGRHVIRNFQTTALETAKSPQVQSSYCIGSSEIKYIPNDNDDDNNEVVTTVTPK